MKKILVPAAAVSAAAWLAVSCTSAHVHQAARETAGVPVAFAAEAWDWPYGKSVISSTSELETPGSRLKVYDVHKIGNRSAVYMDGQEYEYGGGTWTSDPEQYWTREGVHAFTVYNSYDAAGGKSVPEGIGWSNDNDDGSLTIDNWTIGRNNQFDFMYAHHTRDLAAPDPFRPVPLEMKHLLCAVQFNLIDLYYKEENPQNRDKKTEIAVEGFTLGGFYSTADANVPFGGTPVIALDTSSGFSGLLDAGYTSGMPVELRYNIPHKVFASDDYGTEGWVLFWPHSKENFTGVEIKLNYQKTTYTYRGGWQKDRLQPPPSQAELNLSGYGSANNWRAGYRYIYNIYFQEQNISFDVHVVPWIVDDVVIDEKLSEF